MLSDTEFRDLFGQLNRPWAGYRKVRKGVYAKDCENCTTKNRMPGEIRSQIRFEGDLDETQRERLLEIAAGCPVHRTVSSEI